jgi:hypothetical protein
MTTLSQTILKCLFDHISLGTCGRQITEDKFMRQLLLAILLILVPVAAFTGFHIFTAPNASTTTGLGDLTSLKAIVSDVQAHADKGDMATAAARMTDYESAWDQGQTSIRPLNPTYWGNVDSASDVALKALREPHPSANKVKASLSALSASLDNPSKAVL